MEGFAGPPLSRIAVIGNYLPRRCGIATFTTDLCEAIAEVRPGLTLFALPVNDIPEGYAYPPRVRFELSQNDLDSYHLAADFLNMNKVDLVSVQHEFGIFGGPAGSHVLALLRELRMPVVTTLHTILENPDPRQRKTMDRLVAYSDRIVVMTRRATRFLTEIYGVPESKIDLIPHGIPDVPFVDPNFYKDKFGVQGKLVLLTFGLLSPGKGIETMIRALPAVVERFPNAVYIVLGATHPHVKRRDGESYRMSLEHLAEELGVEHHVLFHNRFVTLDELNEFIGSADAYVTPYLNEAQIVSGTLAYAIGAGKAVISTPYWYAADLLAEGRGSLVPFGDADALAGEVIRLLDDEVERHAMRKRAYVAGRDMVWRSVAERYLRVFERARRDCVKRPRPSFGLKTLDERASALPEMDLQHVRRLTDDTGILQHATYTVPNYADGYSSDDNARALLLTVLLEESGEVFFDARDLGYRYLAFLIHAFNRETSRFRNFMAFDRRWQEDVGSEDSHGRSLWALGTAVTRSPDAGVRGPAARLFDRGLPALAEFTSLRSWAYALLGAHEYLKHFRGDWTARSAFQSLGERLEKEYSAHAGREWPWFENILTYGNATLPHALLVYAEAMGDMRIREQALTALRWLTGLQRSDNGHFVAIGSMGFYPRGQRRARFDQQPIEAQATVSACLEALRVTGDEYWREEARRAFDWFLGRNDLRLWLYDPATGSCRDGLHPDRVNENRGAESTLAFLHSLLEMRLMESAIDVPAELDQQA